jgi:DMSO reductase anchor subunit
MQGKPSGQRPPSVGFKQLGRAFAYLRNYRGTAAVAVAALLISILAQLLVPQMIQNILDAVAQGLALQQDAAVAVRESGMAAAMQALLWSIGLILVFAVARGFFAFTALPLTCATTSLPKSSVSPSAITIATAQDS